MLYSSFLYLNPSRANSNRLITFHGNESLARYFLNLTLVYLTLPFFSFWSRWSSWGRAIPNRLSSFRPDKRFLLGLGLKNHFHKRLNFWNFNITGPTVRDGNPSPRVIFKPNIFSKCATILSSLAISPNKSRGWFFKMILLLQVLQTSRSALLVLEKRFVGVPLSSAMFTIISFPVWFFCMSSANQNKPFSWYLPELSIHGAGQEDRSSGYENDANQGTSKHFWFLEGFWRSFQTNLATGHSAFAYRQSHSSLIRGGGRQSVNIGKLTRQTVGQQLLGNMEARCTFRSIAWGLCGALSSYFIIIALFVRGHLYLGPGHTGILCTIILNSGDSCSVSVSSTYKVQNH